MVRYIYLKLELIFKKNFNHNKTLAYQLEKYKYIEIDNKIDLKLVRIIKKYFKKWIKDKT